jgi:3-hydroxypropanoate dehydrogenase
MSDTLSQAALDTLFREARTFNYFLDRPVDPALLAEAATLAEFGPTEANTLPGRFLFVTSPEAKAKLGPAMSEGNRAKTLAAPANVVVAADVAFYEHLPLTFPHVDARAWYVDAEPAAKLATAAKSTMLQAAYLILALRSLGLDAGPMGGFDAAAVDAAFFAGTTWRTQLVVNVGYGDRARLRPRNPRLALDQFTRFV